MTNPTASDRLALALCRAIATELATILRERHGGASQVADWLDGVSAHG